MEMSLLMIREFKITLLLVALQSLYLAVYQYLRFNLR